MNPLTYSPRLVKAFAPLKVKGRTLKVYGIFAVPEACSNFPSSERLYEQVAPLLAEPLQQEDHGLGFLILHFAKDGDYLLMSHWYDANMLKHQVYCLETDAQGNAVFVSLAESGVIACVWELEVMKFERDAWIRTVLTSNTLDHTNIEAYLAMTFS